MTLTSAQNGHLYNVWVLKSAHQVTAKVAQCSSIFLTASARRVSIMPPYMFLHEDVHFPCLRVSSKAVRGKVEGANHTLSVHESAALRLFLIKLFNTDCTLSHSLPIVKYPRLGPHVLSKPALIIFYSHALWLVTDRTNCPHCVKLQQPLGFTDLEKYGPECWTFPVCVCRNGS